MMQGRDPARLRMSVLETVSSTFGFMNPLTHVNHESSPPFQFRSRKKKVDTSGLRTRGKSFTPPLPSNDLQFKALWA